MSTMISLNTNTAANMVGRQLRNTNSMLSKTFERLSTGLRVNHASDDPGAMAIASGMTTDIRSFNQATRNANDAISMVQVAEGALVETQDALQRLRELTVQALSGSNTSTERGDIWEEVNQLISEIDRIASDTTYNNLDLLNGTFSTKSSGVTFNVGINASATVTLNIDPMDASAVGVGQSLSLIGTFSFGGGSTNTTDTTVFSATDQTAYLTSMITRADNALDSVADIRAKLGALQSRMEVVGSLNAAQSENFQDARSNLIDADMASEATSLARNAILQQSGIAVLSQANLQPSLILKLIG
ncbi:MAG: flagellin FliC [Magnetococcales bacterium]|nr:flagellin FliC [Magnetococcales bacterium]